MAASARPPYPCRQFLKFLNGAAFDTAVAPLIDGSEWARCFALQTLCGISDTYTRGLTHNLYFYQCAGRLDDRQQQHPVDWSHCQ